jgi:2-polyprenyl-6-methoxyphenol hydroxylase-like FAD-dependent oxidoreductase
LLHGSVSKPPEQIAESALRAGNAALIHPSASTVCQSPGEVRSIASIVVLGAGVAGLASAIKLARSGHEVTILDRDPASPAGDGDAAFGDWDRRHVPQFRQGHVFMARARTLLLEHAPDVVDRLLRDGVEEVNFFKLLAPPELHRPEDDDFTSLLVRRPAFERTLERVAAETPGVRIRRPVRATSVEVATENGGVRVRGINLEGGYRIACDVLIDAGGRRSPVVRWLRDAGVEVPEQVEDCGITYYSRYFRQRPSSELPQALINAIRGELDGVITLGFPGDHRTYGVAFSAASWDDELKVLRHTWAWDALAATIPRVAQWTHPETGEPLQDVEVMGGHQNVRRQLVVHGAPVAGGVLPVGDALCTTNPSYGWGASMALTHAFAAGAALVRAPGDPHALALAYDAAIRDETDAVFRESAALDRLRTLRWRGDPVPDDERDEEERQSLISEGLAWGAIRDPDLGRAFLRRINLLESPCDALADPIVRKKAAEIRAEYRRRSRAESGPRRADLLGAIAAARPK